MTEGKRFFMRWFWLFESVVAGLFVFGLAKLMAATDVPLWATIIVLTLLATKWAYIISGHAHLSDDE